MEKSFSGLLEGYRKFRDKYVQGDDSVMRYLASHGQKPETMVIACCDSRVDPAVILQCGLGDLFVVRNVANIIPPYEKDAFHHGTSAALEFGICSLNVKHLIIFGHSQCGGIHSLLNGKDMHQNDFIENWVSLIKTSNADLTDENNYARQALIMSYQHCLTFPWIQERVSQKKLSVHLWFFDIGKGLIFAYSNSMKEFKPLK